MFERFTKDARAAVVQAQEQARDLRHDYVGTEHLLLALLEDEDGPIASAVRDHGVDQARVRDAIIKYVGVPPAGTDPLPEPDGEDAAALKAIGIDLNAVRRAIEENFGPDALRLPGPPERKRRGLRRRFSGGGGHIPFTGRAKKVLELSLREAIRLRHNFIAPEHIMLGIIREGEGLSALILTDAGVDMARLRADLARALKDKAA
jgi:ATP-dependent Clp protease ATP-binding subunit ClpA